ncbi:hypothetical protein ACSSS7_001213 [Eimeria intestinalis]
MGGFPGDGPQSIEDLVYGTEWQPDAQSREEILSSTQYSQVAIFAVELALSKVLMDRGLKPDIVLGHSLGEYAAAAVAGVMGWEDALCLVAKRASLLAEQPKQDGVMVASRISAATVQTALTTQLPHLQAVSLAGDNGPQSVTIAGNKEQVDELLEYLGVAASSKRLQVSHAFHSPLMAGAVSEMEALASSVKFQPPSIAIASTVYGRMLEASETPDAHYWATQLTLPVRFREAVEAAVAAAASDRIVFVEVGPQRTLVNMANQILKASASLSLKYLEVAGRDKVGESLEDIETRLEQISASIVARAGVFWNHKKFQFPLQDAKHSREQAGKPSTTNKELPGPLWKTSWTSLPTSQDPDKRSLQRAIKWLFCGVPEDHVADFRSMLKSSDVMEAEVIAGGTDPGSLSLHLRSGEAAEGIVFVGGLWTSQTHVACVNDLRQMLLAYCKAAESDPGFAPPVAVVCGCDSSCYGIPSNRETQKEDLYIRHSGLLGMCRTSRLEIQKLCKKGFKMLFVNVEEGVSALTNVLKWIHTQFELQRENSVVHLEDDVVISRGTLMAPRLVKLAIAQKQNPVTISSSRAYIVTGGTGGLGLAVAEWLLSKGAGLVVLLSRSGKPSDALRQTRAWKAVKDGLKLKRAELTVCDVASKQLAFDTLLKIHRKVPIGGVFHCAGIEGESALQNTTLRSIQSVFEPKVDGAWNLHNACQELDIEKDLGLFVLFSSISTLPGNDALATYAAANAYLDALAYWRRSQGLQAQSIQWGPWKDVGMATRNEKFERVFRSRGINPFSPAEGIAVMEKALQTGEPCVCALSVDWGKYARAFGQYVPMALSELAGSGQLRQQEPSANGLSKDALETVVLEAASTVVDREESVTAETRLDDLGLDSLGSVELRNIIQERLGMSLPASLLLEFSTLGEVIEFIADDVKRPAPGGASTGPTPKGSLPDLSEDGFAVIGMGCRLPGKSNSPEDFWQMLMAGIDCVTEIPWQRFNIQPLFDPDPEENKCYVKDAALIDNAHLFDNEFFRMSESQARNIDPQQRVLLEVAYETFVDAQYHREALKGKEFGVFCATYTNEYQLSSLTKGENGILAIGEGADGGVPRLGEASGYPEPGGLMCLIPNRISYSMGFIGPSIGFDTACASGLVALDAAVKNLKLSACSQAFVGAVSLILVPCFFLGGSKTRQFSKSGRCRTFDAAADGLVRGEGAAGVLLAPLRTARSESKFVHAVVRGTATSHYGQGARLTAPNTRALARVLNQALESGGVDQSQVRCYEAHGTATVLGDIIEMNALRRVFANRSADAPLVVGTAHNNIGHLDSAAALVAFVKTVLSLKHHYVPPNIMFNKLHPDIGDFDATKIIYTKKGQAIYVPDGQAKLFGANLAYGLGGTVVAAITEEGDDPQSAPTITRHVWRHNSFPLDAQKFVFLLGGAAQLAQDRKYKPWDDVAALYEALCASCLTKQNLTKIIPRVAPEMVSQIFLTGATGLIGSQILLNLLDQQIASGEGGFSGFPRIYCLVRARDRMHAMYRIVDSIVGRGQEWKSRYFEQVVPVVGDLAAPLLGLSRHVFETLASTVEAVYHAGRVTDFALPYEAVRKANVLSLQPLIELCTTTNSKHLHVLSDFAAHIEYFAAFAKDLNVPIKENLSVSHELLDRMENQMPASVVGYPWARWAVEEVLAKTQRWVEELHDSHTSHAVQLREQFSFSVYRMANTAVYFNNGRVEFRNPFFIITAAAIQQGVLPPGVLPVGPPFLTTPIDIAANVLATISRTASPPSVVHIVNPVGVRRKATEQAFGTLGIPYKQCSEDDFLRGIEKNQNGSPAYPLLPLMRVRAQCFENCT